MIRYKKITWLSLATLLYTAPTHSAQTYPLGKAVLHRPPTHSPQLGKAAQDGNQAAIQSLIAAGEDLNGKDNNGKTPLMKATNLRPNNIIQLLTDASYHRGNLTQKLIDAGANPNLQDNNGKTPLMNAAMNDDENIARSLIDAGANLDLQDNNGKTALIHAETYYPRTNAIDAAYPRGNVTQLLIDAGADFDLQDNTGMTPLMYAALGGHESIVQMLLKRGASLPTESQWTAMLNAQNLSQSQIERAKQLIDRNRDIVQRHARAAGEYFESEGMPADIAHLTQQIGVEGLPPERARPVPEGE